MDDESLDGYCGADPDAARRVMAKRDPCPCCKGSGDVGDDSPRGCPECGGTGIRNHHINPVT